MNAHDAFRTPLADHLRTDPAAVGWAVTLGSWEPINATKMIAVGHPVTFGPESLRVLQCDLAVTLWVNEVEQAQAVADGYQLAETLVYSLADDVEFVTGVEVQSVGPQEQGPTGFIAFNLLVACRKVAG